MAFLFTCKSRGQRGNSQKSSLCTSPMKPTGRTTEFERPGHELRSLRLRQFSRRHCRRDLSSGRKDDPGRGDPCDDLRSLLVAELQRGGRRAAPETGTRPPHRRAGGGGRSAGFPCRLKSRGALTHQDRLRGRLNLSRRGGARGCGTTPRVAFSRLRLCPPRLMPNRNGASSPERFSQALTFHRQALTSPPPYFARSVFSTAAQRASAWSQARSSSCPYCASSA